MADRLTVEELALIAEKVMGWTAKKEYDSFGYPECWVLHGIAWNHWNPQDSDADAMAVERELLTTYGYNISYTTYDGYRVWKPNVRSMSYDELRDAICAVALVVVEERRNG